MADEPETPTLVEEPPTAEQAVEPEVTPKPEAVPEAAQEPAQDAESGEQPSEDEAPELTTPEAIAKQMRDMAEANPELKEAMEKQGLGGDVPVEAEQMRVTLENEEAQKGRTARWNRADAASRAAEPQALRARVEDWLGRGNEQVTDAATKLHDGTITDPTQVGLDPRSMTDEIMPVIQNVQAAATERAEARAFYLVGDSLQKSSAYSAMPQADRAAMHQHLASGNWGLAVDLVMTAMAEAAPGAADTAATAKAEAELKLIAAGEKLLAQVGTNGKVPAATKSSKGPSTLEEINEALISGPTKDIDANLKKLAALEGR